MAERPVNIAVTARFVPHRSWIANSGEVVRSKVRASWAAGNISSVGTSPNTKNPAANEMPAKRTSEYFLLVDNRKHYNFVTKIDYISIIQKNSLIRLKPHIID